MNSGNDSLAGLGGVFGDGPDRLEVSLAAAMNHASFLLDVRRVCQNQFELAVRQNVPDGFPRDARCSLGHYVA